MTTTKKILFSAASFLTLATVFLINQNIASANISPADISYPVQELGGCADQSSCMAYCNQGDHMNACLDFAKKNSLMSDAEISIAKKFMAADFEGPGGCTDKGSCEAYCNDMANINKCVAFAEQNVFLLPEELEDAKRVQDAIARGIKPPACRNKKECDSYCRAADHMEECVAFGESAGFIKGKELADAKKILAATKRGLKMPCGNPETCRKDCSQPSKMEACMAFALEADLMSGEEKEHAEKMLQAIRNGAIPPSCQGEAECRAYCATEENVKECTNFARAAGLITIEQAQMAEQTGGRGPGNCNSEETCEAFCQEHPQVCREFSQQHNSDRQPEMMDRPLDERIQQDRPVMSTCSTPEECQKLWLQMQGQTQNPPMDPSQMMAPPPMDFQQLPTDQPPVQPISAPTSFFRSLVRFFTSALSAIFLAP